MLGIEIISKGKFLRLDPQTKIKISLRNAAYLGNSNDYSTDVIPTAFSFPTEITLDAYNMALLSHPQKIDNAVAFLNDEPVRIWAKGIVLFHGNLSVRAVRGNRCSFDITVNTVNDLKNTKVNALPLDRLDLGSYTALSRANGSIFSPDLYNFIFAPVWNPDFWEPRTDLTYEQIEYQNAFDPTISPLGEIVNDTNSLTPHPKLTHVLQKMFELSGFSLDNQFQTTRELRWLLVHSNASITTPTGNFTILDYDTARGLPEISSGEFLRHICRRFALAPFVNFFTNEAVLMPFSTMLNAAVVHDWTNIALIKPQIKQDSNFPRAFMDKVKDGFTPDFSGIARYATAPSGSDPDGIYANSGAAVYWKLNPISFVIKHRVNLDPSVNTPGTGAEYENGIGTMPQALVHFDGVGTSQARICAVRQKGTYNTDTADQTTANDARLFFFRGFFGNGALDTFPCSSLSDKDVNGNNVRIGWEVPAVAAPAGDYSFTPYDAAHSLEWSGTKGVFEKFWKGNYEFLKAAKTVTFAVRPTLAQLLNFKFQDKIAIENMAYFVKRLDLTIDSAGDITEGEAEMLTTV